jgi:hypothetical protein
MVKYRPLVIELWYGAKIPDGFSTTWKANEGLKMWMVGVPGL